MADCIFLINIAGFVQNAVVGDAPNRQRNIEEVVRIMDNTSITVQSVEQDADTGFYLSRWVNEFGTIIFWWDSFNMDIAQLLPRVKFETLMTIFRQDPQKHQATLESLEQLRPSHSDIQRLLPGGHYRTSYMKFFVTDVYRNYREISEKWHRENPSL